jgi:transposase
MRVLSTDSRPGSVWCDKPDTKFGLGAQRHHRLLPPEVSASAIRRIFNRRAPVRDSRRTGMDVMYERCCGIDVHKDSVVACVVTGPKGASFSREVRSFGTTTDDLLKLRDWLEQEKVAHVAMESTGVYWKPVYNVLEGGPDLLLVNAQHVKALPGRKTDVKDCEWLADLLRHGLVKSSFVPDVDTRELRELTRYRSQMVGTRASEVNRIQKVLEGANLKVGSVLTDILGVSGRAILDAIVGGEKDPEKLADEAVESVRKHKRIALVQSLNGRIRDHHRFMLKQLLEHIDQLDEHIGRLSSEIKERLDRFEEPIRRLDAIPGVGRRAAEVIVAEIGTDMSRFPSAAHLCSWAGICPGNKASGGKRLSGKTRKGSPWLKGILIEAGWGAIRTKNSYYRALYLRLKRKHGVKKAIVAVAHSILRTIYYMLSRQTEYHDLGVDYFQRQDAAAIAAKLKRKIESLGFDVSLKKRVESA